MTIELVDFNNYKIAIKIQNEIFPNEDGTLNILASLDRELFMKKTGMFYEDDNVKYYIAYINNEAIGITGIYHYQKDEAWLAWFGVLPKHNVKLWNNKKLNLLYQAELDHIDRQKTKEILKIYDEITKEFNI